MFVLDLASHWCMVTGARRQVFKEEIWEQCLRAGALSFHIFAKVTAQASQKSSQSSETTSDRFYPLPVQNDQCSGAIWPLGPFDADTVF
jgi:hypothetical protein